MGKKKQEPVDPNNLKPEDVLKFEIAAELGLADKVVAGGWRCLTAKESGRMRSLITRKKTGDGRTKRRKPDVER